MKQDLHILWVATGKKFIEECASSIASVKLNVKNYNTILHVVVGENDILPFVSNDVNIYRKKIDKGYSFKVQGICEFKIVKNFLFLDTDTYVLSIPDEVHQLFTVTSLSATPDPLISTWQHNRITRPEGWAERNPLPEINSGVMFIRNHADDGKNYLSAWHILHKELVESNSGKNMPDQASLMEALYRTSTLPLYLDNRYNMRACYPLQVYGAPFIVHCHTPKPERIAMRLRAQDDLVISFPWGLFIKRRGWLNKILYYIARKIDNA